MAFFKIGTCSWKYDSWKGLVYSSARPQNYLQEYAQRYSTVEIDQWFWSLHGIDKVTLPQTKTAEEYAASVPDDFRFTIKIPNSITLTHFYRKDQAGMLTVNPYFLSSNLFSQFLETLKPLKAKAGPLMFQFEYLNRQKMSGLKEFIQRFETFLAGIDRNYEYGIELRNPNFLNASFFDFLLRNNLRMVFLQGYYMPPVWDVYNSFGANLEKTVIIRLHGDERKGIEEKSGGAWNSIITARDAEIQKVKEMIRSLHAKGVDVYVNVNNHYEGSAPLTIQKFIQKKAEE